MFGPGSRRWLLRAAAAAGLWLCAPAAAQVSGAAGATLELGAGYDTNLFLDATPALPPGQPATTTPRADPYFHLLVQPRAALRRAGHGLDVDYAFELRATDRYGAIMHHTGRAAYRTPRRGGLDLTVALGLERQDFEDAVERLERSYALGPEAVVSAQVGGAVRLWLGYRYARRAYPGLALPAAAGTRSDDEQTAQVGGSLRPAAGLELALLLASTHNGSTDSRLVFDRGRAALLARWQARPFLALGADYTVAGQYLPLGAEDPLGRSGKVTLGARRDLLQGVALHAALRVGRGVELFARYDGSFAWSSLDALSYRRHAGVAGVRLSWAGAWGTAAAAAAGPAALAPPGPDAGHRVRFRLEAPTARAVAVVGDFNGWDPARGVMARSPGGAWTVELALTPGRHTYGFVVDGAPVTPPQAPTYTPDGFGGRNAVIEVAR